MSYVQLFPGHYALMMDSQGTSLYDTTKSAREVAATLIYQNIPGFYFPKFAHRMIIAKVVHVMPKTFVGNYAFELVDGTIRGFGNRGARMWRNHVIACAQSAEAAVGLRRKLLRIGADADRQIAAEMQACEELQELKRRVDEIESSIARRVHDAAQEDLRQSLPELFGRSRRTAA